MEKENSLKENFKQDFFYLGVMAIITSFLGWFIENLAKFCGGGNIDSRFHILPFISVYGLIVFAVYLLIGNPNDITMFGKHLFKEKSKKKTIFSNITTILLIYFAVFFGELIVGNLWNLLFGVKLWNYSHHLTHVTQFTSLRSTFSFGTLAFVLVKYIYYPSLNYLKAHMSYKTAKLITCIVYPLIIVDSLVMYLSIIFFHKAPVYWHLKLK